MDTTLSSKETVKFEEITGGEKVYLKNLTYMQHRAKIYNGRGECDVTAHRAATYLFNELYEMLNIALNEIAGIFTKNEIFAVADMMNGVLIEHILIKDVLLTDHINDSCNYFGLEKKWNINKCILIDKLMKLEKFQRYALLRFMDAYWSKEVSISNKTLSDLASGNAENY